MANLNTPTRDPYVDRPNDGSPKWIGWVIGLLLVAALVIALFFAFGGDADVDTEPGSVDVEAPSSDVDVDAPDVDGAPPAGHDRLALPTPRPTPATDHRRLARHST